MSAILQRCVIAGHGDVSEDPSGNASDDPNGNTSDEPSGNTSHLGMPGRLVPESFAELV